MSTLIKNELNEMELAIYNTLLSELGFTGKQLSEKQEDDLIFLTRHVYRDVDDFANYRAKDMYDLVRRLEGGDIPWLKLWKRYYENEQDESEKFSMLKWGVCSLVYEDMRTIPFSCVFSNSRHSFSEIHEDYARVLGIGIEDVSSAIEALISGRFLEKKESVLGVVYVGVRMYDKLDMRWRYE
jgi:hypothetical protein